MWRQQAIEDIALRITAVKRPHPVRVAIDGVDAAGKTTLADELVAVIRSLGRDVIRASIDGFHNPSAIRRSRGPLSPEGYFHDSFNYPALIDSLLEPLGPGGSRAFRRAIFDFRTDAPVETPVEHAAPDAILLLDGVFLRTGAPGVDRCRQQRSGAARTREALTIAARESAGGRGHATASRTSRRRSAGSAGTGRPAWRESLAAPWPRANGSRRTIRPR